MADPITNISKFLGINLDPNGELSLQLGESNYMRNFRVTDSYKLEKRDGYVELFDSITNKTIRGMWYGKLSGTNYFLFACGGVLYVKRTLSGTVYDSLDTSSYTHVDVIKTTAYAAAVAGTTAVDGFTIVTNSTTATLK
jgi:hypothetical protein